jgi:hypothetical protein
MANTFTTNYDFVKSEIGGDNQSWGNNLHTTLNLADIALAKAVENQLMSGITSNAIDLTAFGDNGIISTSTNLKYFESVVIGDKIRVSGSIEAINGTAAIPKIHTVTAKTSADSITTNINVTTDTTHTITVAKVLEPVHINSGPIVCAPLTNLNGTLPSTRTSGGVGVPGADTTDALKVNGNVILGTAGGTVTSLVIVEGGTGYSAGSLTISGGGGSSATATYTVSGGVINATTITAAGSGYTSAPNISASGGTGAVIVAHIAASPDTIQLTGRVKSDIIPNADNSYDLGSSTNEWQDLWINNIAYIDSLVADTAAISGGSITGGTGAFTTLAVGTGAAPSDGTTINMTGYTIGTNARNNRTVSTGDPVDSGAVDGDVHYRY